MYSHPKRAMLTSALGVFQDARIDIMKTQLMQEDILIFATDGIYRCMSPQDVIDKLASEKEISKGVDKILSDAKKEECPDNCTLICAYVYDDNGIALSRVAEIKPVNSYQARKDNYIPEKDKPTDLYHVDKKEDEVYNPYRSTSTGHTQKKKKRSYLYDF